MTTYRNTTYFFMVKGQSPPGSIVDDLCTVLAERQKYLAPKHGPIRKEGRNMVNVALWTRFYVGSKIVALATDDVNGTWVGKVYDQLWTVDETADVFELLSAGNVTDFTNTEVSERVNVNYGLGVDEDVVIGSFYNGFDGRSVTVYHLYKDGTLAVEVL